MSRSPPNKLQAALFLDNTLALARQALYVPIIWASIEIFSLADSSGIIGQFLLYFNGPVVGIYGYLLAVRLKAPTGSVAAVLFAFLGLTHLLWVNPIVTAPFASSASRAGQMMLMFAATGVVFGALAAVATRRFGTLLWAATAVAVSLVLCTFGAQYAPIAAAATNLAIATPMYLEIRRRRTVAMAKQIGACGACGYDLAGLAAPMCPECGTSIGTSASTSV